MTEATQQQATTPAKEQATQDDVSLAKSFLARFDKLDLSEMPPVFFRQLAQLVPPAVAAERLSFEDAKRVYKERTPKEFPPVEFDALDFDESDTSAAASIIRITQALAFKQYPSEPHMALRYEKVLLRRKVREMVEGRATVSAEVAAFDPPSGTTVISNTELDQLRRDAAAWQRFSDEISRMRAESNNAGTTLVALIGGAAPSTTQVG